MDKKNTMLLTVIAVATLLVAVVGATFAYFSLTTTGNGGTTTVTSNVGKLPTITVNGSKETLNLNLTTTDMAKPDVATNYYAIKGTDSNDSKSGGKWSNSAQNLQAGSIAVTNIEDNTNISCTTSVAVNLSGTMVGHLTKGDAFLVLKGYITNGDGAGQTIDLTDIGSLIGSNDDATRTTTYTGKITLNKNKATEDLQADLYIVNKQEDSQNHLAEKSLTVTITSTATCAIEPASAE